MPDHKASCSCGQLTAKAEGDPVGVSVCHCLACQRRTGSAFGVQARFPHTNVRTSGESREYARVSDDGEERRSYFCPECGSTVFYMLPAEPDLVAIAVGAFADPAFPPPTRSVWEARRHAWVTIPTATERYD